MRARARAPPAQPRAAQPRAAPPRAAPLILPLLMLLLASQHAARAQAHVANDGGRHGAIQDSRCYLMNGGAVESFFISEDTPVGSVIGTLSVNGDPGEDQGDISLRLQERGAAVGIAPGSKNLTLLRALDREEKKGPSNVYVNVRCDRRRTTDPSFIIPVSVRVWDVNDNAPVWLGAPYRVRLSELSAVGSRVPISARAVDADQAGPHATIHYSVLPGPNSEYFGFANELDSVLVIKKPLDYETLNNFTVTLRASDAGTPPLHNDTTLLVEVLDADDQNPSFAAEHYTAVLPDDAREGTVLSISPGPISAVDQDKGINAPIQYSATGDSGRLLVVERDSGQVAATRTLLDDAHQPVTVVIKATQVDNPDRYALATLTVSRAGSGPGSGSGSARAPVRFRRRQFAGAASEAAPPGSVLLTLHTDPPHSAPDSDGLQFYVSDRSFLDKFAINSAGEVVLRRPLDYEVADSYHYQVMVTDGVANDTASINITVQNVNEWEPRFRYAEYEFRVEDQPGPGAELLPVGQLEVFDGDTRDDVTLTLRGPDSNMLWVNSSGAVFVRGAALRARNATELHVVATAVDSGAPPRQSSVPVTVHVSERLLQRTERPTESGFGVVPLFAAALAALALLVCALLVYIFTVRRRSKRSSSNHTKSTSYVTPEKPRAPSAVPSTAAPHSAGRSGGPGDAGGTLVKAGSSGSLLSVSAGASTILANSNSSLDLRADTLPSTGLQTNGSSSARQSQRFPRSKVAPLPPSGMPASPAAPDSSLMSDHLRARDGGRSGVAWPSATIPARVKKLSWDDANKGSGGEAALTDATNTAVQEHMNLTVYF